MTKHASTIDLLMKDDPEGTRQYLQQHHGLNMGTKAKQIKKWIGYDIPSLTSTTS